MTFSAFRASKAFKTMFDEFVSMGADVEKSAGRALTSKEIKTILADDKTLQTRLRASLNSFIDASRHEGIDAAEAQRQFVTGLMGQLPPQTRAALSKEGEAAEKELAAVKVSLNNLVSEKPAEARPLAAGPRVDRVPQPTGVIDGLIRNPEKLAKVGGPSVTTALRDYEPVLEGAIKRVNRDGVKELSAAEKVAFRAVGDAFKKDSTEAGRGITATQAHDNLLDAMGFEKGTKTRQEMSALLGKPAEGGGRKPPPAARQEPTLGEPPASRKTEPAEAAGEAPRTRAEIAEEVISDSVRSMMTVQGRNGRMPTDAFFSELHKALKNNGLMLTSREGDLATTPQQVYNRIATRQPVTEQEMGVLSLYFSRFHNDTKAAKELSTQATSPNFTQARGGVVGAIEAVARKIPVSEGVGRISPTVAQTHSWETGATSLIRNIGSNFQERPIRNTVSALALGATAFFGQQTLATVMDFENPNYWGHKIIDFATKDKAPTVADYAEYMLERYNNNPQKAFTTLKDRYGLNQEDLTAANSKNIMAALEGAPLKHTEDGAPKVDSITSEQKAALYMFTSQRIYGNPVGSGPDFNALSSENATKQRSATAQAGMNNPDSVARGVDFDEPSAEETSAYAEYQVDGASFNNRVKGITSNDTKLYDALAKAFTDATHASVKPEDELTAANKLTKDEATLFAQQAKEILTKRNIDPEKVKQLVDYLIEPSSPALAPGR